MFSRESPPFCCSYLGRAAPNTSSCYIPVAGRGGFVWPCVAGSQFPEPGLNLAPALEAQSLNHWTIREVHTLLFLKNPEGL